VTVKLCWPGKSRHGNNSNSFMLTSFDGYESIRTWKGTKVSCNDIDAAPAGPLI
jgi:hypothetical protein